MKTYELAHHLYCHEQQLHVNEARHVHDAGQGFLCMVQPPNLASRDRKQYVCSQRTERRHHTRMDWRRITHDACAQTYWENLKRRPFLLLGPPLVIFAICVALGVYGVVAGADQYEDDQRSRVRAP